VGVVVERSCSRNGCDRPAVATLAYNYAAAMAHLAPLAPVREPGAHDLCRDHAHALTVPRGWTVTRLATVPDGRTARSPEVLALLADRVRAVGLRDEPGAASDAPAIPAGGRPHLRLLRGSDDGAGEAEPRERHGWR